MEIQIHFRDYRTSRSQYKELQEDIVFRIVLFFLFAQYSVPICSVAGWRKKLTCGWLLYLGGHLWFCCEQGIIFNKDNGRQTYFFLRLRTTEIKEESKKMSTNIGTNLNRTLISPLHWSSRTSWPPF